MSTIGRALGVTGAIAIGAVGGAMLGVAMPSATANPSSLLVVPVITIGALSLGVQGAQIAAMMGGMSPATGKLLGLAGFGAGLGAVLLLPHLNRRNDVAPAPSPVTSPPEPAPVTETVESPGVGIGGGRPGVWKESFYTTPGAVLGGFDMPDGRVNVRLTGNEYSVGFAGPGQVIARMINDPHNLELPHYYAAVGVEGAPLDRHWRAAEIEFVDANGAPIDMGDGSITDRFRHMDDGGEYVYDYLQYTDNPGDGMLAGGLEDAPGGRGILTGRNPGDDVASAINVNGVPLPSGI